MLTGNECAGGILFSFEIEKYCGDTKGKIFYSHDYKFIERLKISPEFYEQSGKIKIGVKGK